VTMVVSPLLSLIRDQEDQMNAFFPDSALSFTSGLAGGNAEHARRWDLVRNPHAGVCLIFVTPEKVHGSGKLKAELQKLHEQGRLGRFVIDECHCACQWGHDFRPDYAKLGILKAHFPTVPILAVTATASDKVREECIHILQMNPHHRFFRSTANRPNLNYSVRLKDDGKDAVLDDMACFIQEKWPRGAGIIYTYSKKDADTVADRLLERGIVAEAYHSECVFDYFVMCVWNP
jgi:superfamily II DNA helicase RecQ